MVNISHLKNDLEGKYGEINENLWEEIDNYRTYDKDIGYLHDDFLYWKLLWRIKSSSLNACGNYINLYWIRKLKWIKKANK